MTVSENLGGGGGESSIFNLNTLIFEFMHPYFVGMLYADLGEPNHSDPKLFLGRTKIVEIVSGFF